MDAARPRIRVHVIAVDDDQRMLLARKPGTVMWTLPWDYLKTNEDPSRVVRNLIRETGASPGVPRGQGIESAVEHGEHFLDLTFRCGAERVWKATPWQGGPLWWSLDEMTSLDLTARAKSTLVHAWPQLWPNL
ncbi:hypothetical protein N802_15465 [Knoellia sinensis KCTC 19936]|uniref:Nudix hydrolase domain-containing protein n=1 Tax=Knoellia sinensis KCTC 19936 TaxID=1385520 RepID=A0A0A0JAI5_9MICO|nr:hypothetical protein [Knoellia sinensis]KGN32997.1 hypothetical protein N802_15465 [Knoellia sinensis KCTC 19936]